MKKLSFGLMLLFGSFFVGADMFACDPVVIHYTTNTGNNKVYFGGSEIIGADASTRQLLGDYFAKDKNNVYYFREILSGADPLSYKKISGPFWGDDNQVFFGHKVTAIKRKGFDGENKIKKNIFLINEDIELNIPAIMYIENIVLKNDKQKIKNFYNNVRGFDHEEVSELFYKKHGYSIDSLDIGIYGIYKNSEGRILLYFLGDSHTCDPDLQYIQIPKNLASTLFIRKAQKISSGSGTVSKSFTKQFLKYVQTNSQPQ